MEAPNFESIFECISDGVNKVLVLVFSWKFDNHPTPCNNNNVEPHLRNAFLPSPLARSELRLIYKFFVCVSAHYVSLNTALWGYSRLGYSRPFDSIGVLAST